MLLFSKQYIVADTEEDTAGDSGCCRYRRRYWW